MSNITFCTLILIFSLAFATEDPKNAVLTNYEFYRGPSNNYQFQFDSSDGTSRQEQGKDDPQKNLAINGAVSWVSEDGSRYQMTFKADKKGFRPIIKRISKP